MSPEGNIKSEQTHTPINQAVDKSAEDFRRIMLMIKGIFHNGKQTEAISPIVSHDIMTVPLKI